MCCCHHLECKSMTDDSGAALSQTAVSARLDHQLLTSTQLTFGNVVEVQNDIRSRFSWGCCHLRALEVPAGNPLRSDSKTDQANSISRYVLRVKTKCHFSVN